MKREIKIFRSFEEMDEYKLQQARNTSPLERFKNLYLMQNLTAKIHKPGYKTRKITNRSLN
jgi:hypothetical protein